MDRPPFGCEFLRPRNSSEIEWSWQESLYLGWAVLFVVQCVIVALAWGLASRVLVGGG